MLRHLPGPAWLAVGAVVTLGSAGPQTPQFRTGVTLVPVEVSVIDDHGQPVEHLSANDFNIREDGVPQQIAHFEVLNQATAPTPRTFMIVLGRGYLDHPTNALQALIDFVHRAPPSDRIGVAAYLRVLPVSVDHAAVERFLTLFQERHKAIEDKIERDSRNKPVLGPPRLATDTRAAIDALFQAVHLETLDLAGSTGSAESRYNDGYLVNVLDFYLRKVDGEKNTIVVTERPFGAGAPPQDPRDDFWVQKAAAARTALIFLNAGGLRGQTFHKGAGLPKYQWVGNPLPPLLGDFVKENVDRLEDVAAKTGGLSSFFEYADQPLTLLDRFTQSRYMLGYYPTTASTATQVRLIDVRVTRTGARLFYRHAYQAEPGPPDPQQYRQAVTSARIELAADRLIHPYVRPADGWQPWGMLSWGNRVTLVSASDTQVRVSFSFDPTWITFDQKDGGYATDLNLVLLADDADRHVVGRTDATLTLRLTPAEFQRTKREWLKYDATIDVTARPAFVRSVLYDFVDDRTGSAQVAVPPRAPER